MGQNGVEDSARRGADSDCDDAQADAASEDLRAAMVNLTVDAPTSKKKRKKKRPKKSNAVALASKEASAPPPSQSVATVGAAGYIARFKHTRYISCYHVSGPWLQLPIELLQTLLIVNSGPVALTGEGTESMSGRRRLRTSYNRNDEISAFGLQEEQVYDYEGQVPPPVDPKCFRTVVSVRQLVEEALDLALRAASGFGFASFDGGRRGVSVSTSRQQRLRVLAVSKLAQAYGLDEVAASVVVMQSGSALDDVADRVIRAEPDHADARYVSHFHEKILGRTYAASTTTEVFDRLIAQKPGALQYYRSKGICLSHKQDFMGSVRTFSQGLSLMKNARQARLQAPISARKAILNEPQRSSHLLSSGDGRSSNGVPDVDVGQEESTPEEDFERQLFFNRGMSYLHAAHALIEEAVGAVEGKFVSSDGLPSEMGELPLSAFGLDVDPIEGLYCASKREQFDRRLGDPPLRERIISLLRRACQDHERFLSTFKIWEAPPASVFEEERKTRPHRPHDQMLAFRGRRLCHHRALSGRTRYGDPRTNTRRQPALLTSYHPLQIESHFALLLCHLLAGSFASLVPLHYRAERLMDYLESYPAFLVSRSQCQSEYVEILERLAQTWFADEVGNAGGPRADEDERDIALRGNLHSLCHLVAFFTSEYDRLLSSVADEPSKSKARSANPTRSQTPSGNPATNGNVGHGDENARTSAKSATAKSEVALVWLRAIIIPQLTSGMADKGKRKAILDGASSAEDRSTPVASGSSM